MRQKSLFLFSHKIPSIPGYKHKYEKVYFLKGGIFLKQKKILSNKHCKDNCIHYIKKYATFLETEKNMKKSIFKELGYFLSIRREKKILNKSYRLHCLLFKKVCHILRNRTKYV